MQLNVTAHTYSVCLTHRPGSIDHPERQDSIDFWSIALCVHYYVMEIMSDWSEQQVADTLRDGNNERLIRATGG